MRPDGDLVFVVGASGAGKTSLVLSHVLTARRLLVWDVEGEYAARKDLKMQVIEDQADLLSYLQHAKHNARVAYHPKSMTEFGFFCRCAFNWGRQKISTIVCEELAASTNAVKARGYWGVLVSRGRKYGTTVYGIAQRAQEIDKSLMGNASKICLMRPNTEPDRIYLSRSLGIDIVAIPTADLFFIERYKSGDIKQKKIMFGKTAYPSIVSMDRI